MTENAVSATPVDEFEDEISLLDLATALGEEKKLIAGVAGFSTVAAVVVSLLISPVFTAKTLVLPPQQQQSAASAALASLGGLAALAGGVAGIKTPDEMYLAFMKSDRISDAIIERFKLREYYETKTQADTRKALGNDAKIASDKKSGLMTIEVDNKDPAVAADMANAYVEELKTMLDKIAVTEAQQRRAFLENQLNQTKERLTQAELNLRTMQAKSGMLSLDAQAQGAMRATVELRGQIAQREVQLGTLRTFATTENAEVQRLSAELGGLRAQLAKLEQGSGRSSGEADDNKGLQTVRAYREVKYQEAIMDALVKQFELAKVDEAREGPLLQQVDVATAPERKSKPKRAMIVAVAGLAGLFVGVLWAFVRRAVKTAASNPEGAEKMRALKRAWSLK